jgi:hypothetical protein
MVVGAVDGVREWDCAEKEEGWMCVGEEEWRVLQVDTSGDEERTSPFLLQPSAARLIARRRFEYSSRYCKSRGCGDTL